MSRVKPEPILLPDFSKYTDFEKNTAFVIIFGVGSKGRDLCIKVETNYYEEVSYNSQGGLRDVFEAQQNAKDLAKSGNIHIIKQHTRERMKKLTESIKKYLIHPDIRKVVVIGCSHGSLLVHGAFLRVQMDMQVTYDLIATKLYIFTIGSPRYLPADLIPSIAGSPLPKLLNVYYNEDPTVNALNYIPKFIFDKRIPKNLDRPRYDKDTAIYIVNETNAMVCLAHTNASEKVKVTEADTAYFKHSSPYILCSLFQNDRHPFHLHYMQHLYNTGTDFSPQCKMSTVKYVARTQEGGSKKLTVKLTDTGRLYRVYFNKQQRKYIRRKGEHVMLSSIKGKYRYVR
jgi:hypothetical protein